MQDNRILIQKKKQKQIHIKQEVGQVSLTSLITGKREEWESVPVKVIEKKKRKLAKNCSTKELFQDIYEIRKEMKEKFRSVYGNG